MHMFFVTQAAVLYPKGVDLVEKKEAASVTSAKREAGGGGEASKGGKKPAWLKL